MQAGAVAVALNGCKPSIARRHDSSYRGNSVAVPGRVASALPSTICSQNASKMLQSCVIWSFDRRRAKSASSDLMTRCTTGRRRHSLIHSIRKQWQLAGPLHTLSVHDAMILLDTCYPLIGPGCVNKGFTLGSRGLRIRTAS